MARFSLVGAGAWLLLVAPPGASGTAIRFDVGLPDEGSSGRLVWGLIRAGREIGSGELDLADVESASGQVAFDAGTTEELGGGDTPVIAKLCINADSLVSYAPSVGDWHCTTPLRRLDSQWVVRCAAVDWKRQRSAAPFSILTVHYHRFDGDYSNVGLWTWDAKLTRAPSENELHPVGRDEFGLVFQVDTALYGEPGDGIGLLPRRNADWDFKDGGDRTWSPPLGMKVYLIQEDARLYTEVPDVTPKVRLVSLDAARHLTLRFSHRLPTADWTPDKFKIATSAGDELSVKAVYPFAHRGDRCAVYSIETDERFEYPSKAYSVEVDGFGTHNVRAGHIVKDPEQFYDADTKLGATYSRQQTTFRAFVPGALAVQVVIADRAEGSAGIKVDDLIPGAKGIWSATVEGDLAGKYYAYRVGGIGFDPNVEITDIYATCTQARHRRSLIVDLPSTDPPGFREHRYEGPTSPADAIIYEMHVRDFTVAANSGIKNKGKYLGLTESGTHLAYEPKISTGIDHLVELGVTHVQLMPVQDFDNDESEGDSYNWGYMPVHFNSPDGWYASNASGAVKISELKQAIKSFHDRGIGVILDVVYNHTAGWAPFDDLVPGYYYRLTNAGNFSNGSGCGNEFATENPMAGKFVVDSLRFWVEEYKVDGFRFDLMGLIDLETLERALHVLAGIHPGILVYGEPWTAGPTPLKPITGKSRICGTGIGAFNDKFRDAIKGDRDGGAPGFIQTGDRVNNVVKGLMGGIHDWSRDPVDSVNYFEAHDNLTAWDKLLQSVPQQTDEVRRRMMRLAALTLFTSQGSVFMHSGQEMCRSKQGSHNSYNLPDSFNQIDWSLKKTYADVVRYHKGMIALRKAHAALRLRTRSEVERRVVFRKPPNGRCVVYAIDGGGLEGEPSDRLLVLLNGGGDATMFDLPDGRWTVHADAGRAGTDVLGEVSGSVELAGHSGMLLVR